MRRPKTCQFEGGGRGEGGVGVGEEGERGGGEDKRSRGNWYRLKMIRHFHPLNTNSRIHTARTL